MNIAKLSALILLLALAGFVLFRCSGDPLAKEKAAEKTEVADPEAEKCIAGALDAIAKNDMKKLSGMMLNGDPMYFDETYVKGIFAGKDFTPASLRAMHELKRADKTFLQAEVFSEQRAKTYIFTLEKDKKGILKISSVEEKPGK